MSRLTANAHSRFESKPVAILSDRQHRPLGRFVVHLLGQDTGFFCPVVPYSGSSGPLKCGAMGMAARCCKRF
jgi:hypothetical protein